MEKDKRGFGDNTRYDKTLLESLCDSVHLLAKTIIKTNAVTDALTKSLHGKNVIERADALRHAAKINQSAVNEVAPFKKVMDAITNLDVTLIMISHSGTSLEYFDKVIDLNDFK